VRRWIVFVLAGAAVALLLAQLVPYGRAHDNPPVTKSVVWDSAATERLARGACYDCHSNETVWPWYSNVAPMSWLVQSDVDGGREHLNFSEWNRPQDADAAEIVESVQSGEMPPFQYKPLHAGGRLSAAERQALASGLERTLRADPPVPGSG
jgi:mono/diheme cytochrome c family protein